MKIERAMFSGNVPTAAAAGTEYDFYLGGPSMQPGGEGYFLPAIEDSFGAVTAMGTASSVYSSPFWQGINHSGWEFEVYIDTTITTDRKSVG